MDINTRGMQTFSLVISAYNRFTIRYASITELAGLITFPLYHHHHSCIAFSLLLHAQIDKITGSMSVSDVA